MKEISRDLDMSNIISSSNFNETQKRKLVAIIAKIFRQQLISSNNIFSNNNNNDNDINNNFDNQQSASTIHSVENIKFFDFIYDDFNDGNFVIINVDKHVFYRNVYVFCDRLKNLAKDFINKQKMKKMILVLRKHLE